MNVPSRLASCLLVYCCCAQLGCEKNSLPAAPPEITPPASSKVDSPAKADEDAAAPDKTMPDDASAETPATATNNNAPAAGAAPQAPVGKPAAPPVLDATGTLECSFDHLKFEMVKGDPFFRKMLTPEIEALVGKRIRIRGYILPSYVQKGLTDFVLVRDNMECCFGPGAALYDCVLVSMQPGKKTDFSIRPVAVEGTFSVDEFIGPDGKHLAIYKLEGEAVK